jgi:AcrR family transcriptional regulator
MMITLVFHWWRIPTTTRWAGSGGMRETRPRNAVRTRADIVSAARSRFAAEGYERTTLRAVAADVGVDAALVIRYFGSKQELFAAAAEFTIELPDLSKVDPDEIAGILLPRFFAVWEEDETFVALLRAAMTSQIAADALRRVFAEQVAPKLITATPDHPVQRIGLMGSFVIGLAITRYVLQTPPIAGLSRDTLSRWATPVIQQLLVGPVPAPHQNG